MRHLQDNATEIAERRERERDAAQDALRDELDRPSRDVEVQALRLERDALRGEVRRLRFLLRELGFDEGGEA
jgi:hypothetical protein